MRGRGSAPGARTGRRAGRLGHFHFAVRRRQFRYVFLGSGRSDAGSEQRISGERCRTEQAHGCAFVFLAPGAAANPVREGLKVRQISCKPGTYVTACVDGMAVYICNAESGI